MFLILFSIMTVVMLIVTISIYDSLNRSTATKWLIKWINKSVFLQMLFNFAVSGVITAFTGSGAVAGAANLTASILFPLFLAVRKSIKGSK